MVDLGHGEAAAFKVESHNHPSAVEPFQGAATGVGGILRDVVAMGARPVALLDGLRFGAPDHDFDRAVAGIGAYGNSVGVPTVGGDTFFDEAYADKEQDRILDTLTPEEAAPAWGELDEMIMTETYPAVITGYSGTAFIHGSALGGVENDNVRGMPTFGQMFITE